MAISDEDLMLLSLAEEETETPSTQAAQTPEQRTAGLQAMGLDEEGYAEGESGASYMAGRVMAENEGLRQVTMQILSGAPQDLMGSLGAYGALQQPPTSDPTYDPTFGSTLDTPVEETRAGAQEGRDAYPESLLYEAKSPEAQAQLAALGVTMQNAVAWLSDLIFDNGDMVLEHGPQKATDMLIDEMDISDKNKNKLKNVITFTPELLTVAAPVAGAGVKAGMSMMGKIPLRGKRTPTTETEAAQILRGGNIDEIVDAADIDPNLAAQAGDMGLDPEADLPSAAFVQDPNMRNVIEVAERTGDESPGQIAARELDDALVNRADTMIEDMEFGSQGRTLRLGDEIPGAASKGEFSYSDTLQKNLDAKATEYRTNVDTHIRPTDPIKTTNADDYLSTWIKNSGNVIPDLPVELQPYARKIKQSDARKELNAEIERVGGAENLSLQYKTYQKVIEAEEASPDLGVKDTITYTAFKTRIGRLKDAERAAEKAGKGEHARNLKELKEALENDLADNLEGRPGNQIDGLSLAQQQRNSNTLYRKGFEVRQTRKKVQTGELTRSIQTVIKREIEGALKTGDLDALELQLKRITEPDLEHVDAKGRPQKYKPIDPNYGLGEDVIVDSTLAIIRGPDWLQQMDALAKNPRLKNMLWKYLPPGPRRELSAYADFTRVVMGRTKKTLSAGEYKTRAAYAQSLVDRIINAGTRAPWVGGGYIVRGVSQVAKTLRGRTPEASQALISKVVASPEFQRAIRFAIEDKGTTKRVQGNFIKLENTEAWKQYQSTLPGYIQAAMMSAGLAAYVIEPVAPD